MTVSDSLKVGGEGTPLSLEGSFGSVQFQS